MANNPDRTTGSYARVVQALMAVAGVALVLMMVHICLEALFRVVLPSVTLHTIVMVSTWYMVVIVFLPMPYVGEVHGHLSVFHLDSLLSDGGKRALRIFASSLSLAYLALLGYLTLLEAIDHTRKGTIIQASMTYIPVWPPYWALPLAIFIMVVGYFRWLYRDVAGLLRANGASD